MMRLKTLLTICFFAWVVTPSLAEDGDYDWDVSADREHLPAMPDSISEGQIQQLARLAKSYSLASIKPNGKGYDEEAFLKLSDRVRKTYQIRRDPETDRVTGRPLRFNNKRVPTPEDDTSGPLELTGDIEPAIVAINQLYRQASAGAQTKQVETLYRDLAQHIVNQGWDPIHEAEVGWLGNGYSWRTREAVVRYLAMRDVLDDNLRNRLCESIAWLSMGSLFFEDSPSMSTDMHLNCLSYAARAYLAMTDTPTKWQRVLCMRRGFDRALLRNDKAGVIGPAGEIIHHEGMHPSYAGYSYRSLVSPHQALAQAGIFGEDTLAATERLIAAGRAWAWMSQPGHIPTNLEMRTSLPPWSEEGGRARQEGGGGPAWYVERLLNALQAADFKVPDNPLREIVLAKKPNAAPAALLKEWEQAGHRPGGMSGHLSLPVSGAALHRRDNLLISLRGANKYFRGGEGMPYGQWGSTITYGRRFIEGSLFIINQGKPANMLDSGYRREGYNLSMLPGTTTTILPEEHLTGRYFNTDAGLGGGVQLDGQGLWGFTPSYCNKSALLIDQRVTMITTDIRLRHNAYPSATTLAQAAHTDPPNQPSVLDGRSITEQGTWSTDEPAGHWFTDHLERGYVVHESTDPLIVARRKQDWTYCEAPHLREAFKKEGLKAAVSVNPAADRVARFRPTSADYTTAWFDHGKQTEAGRNVFTVLVNADAKQTETFAQSLASDNPPLVYSANAQAHTYYDSGTALWGYVMIRAGDAYQPLQLSGDNAPTDPLVGVTRPCFILLKQRQNHIDLAIASTQSDQRQALTCTLRGKWAVESTSRAKAHTFAHYDPNTDTTTVSTPYLDQTQTTITLGPSKK